MNGYSAIVAVTLSLAIGVSSAQVPNSKLIDEAAGAFAGLDFERALELLDRSLEAGGNSPGEMVRIYSLRGLCLVSLGREQLARSSFRAALSIDPAFRLAPDLSPRFQEPFREELQRGVAPLSLRIDFPSELRPEQQILGTAELLSDPEGLAGGLVIYYRPSGRKMFYSARWPSLPQGKSVTFGLQPVPEVSAAAEFLEWYAELQDSHGNRLFLRGDAEHPLRVPWRKLEDISIASTPPPPVAPAPTAVPWYSKWWVWAIAGTVAAAAGGVTVGVLLSRPAPRERDFSVNVR